VTGVTNVGYIREVVELATPLPLRVEFRVVFGTRHVEN
jgi:hypothetical protein